MIISTAASGSFSKGSSGGGSGAIGGVLLETVGVCS